MDDEHLPGFTPVRRRRWPARAVDTTPDNRQPPWTAARCSRLLRPLNSKIEILRGAASYSRIEDVSEANESSCPNKDDSYGDSANPKRRKYGEPDEASSDISFHPSLRKRPKHQYSNRGAKRSAAINLKAQALSHGQKSVIPGVITVPTPIIQRVRSIAHGVNDSEDNDNFATHDRDVDLSNNFPAGAKRSAFEGRRARNINLFSASRTSITGPTRSTYEGLFSVYDSLLKTTSSSNNLKVVGPQSLLSLCLRKVPARINAEAQWQSERIRNTKGDSCRLETALDVTDSFYTDLESLGDSQRKGWKHLREVLRAHATLMLSDAMQEGIFHVDFSLALFRLCLENDARHEGAALYSALLTTIPALHLPSSTRSVLEPTVKYRILTDCILLATTPLYLGIGLRQLAWLVKEQRIPPEWLATRTFQDVWRLALKDLAGEDSGAAAASEFVVTALTSTLGLEERRKEQNAAACMTMALGYTVSSLLSTLLALDFLGRNQGVAPRMIIQYLAVNARQIHANHKGSTAWSLVIVQRMAMMSFAQTLWCQRNMSVNGDRFVTAEQYRESICFTSELIELSESLEKQVQHPDPSTMTITQMLANLACSVACCCGRASQNQGYEDIRLITDGLLSVRNGPVASRQHWSEEVQSTFDKLALEIAFSFAAHTEENEHIDWAQALEASLYQISEPSKSHGGVQFLTTPMPTTGRTRNLRQWEAGRGSIAAATPLAGCGDQLSSLAGQFSSPLLGGESDFDDYLPRKTPKAAHRTPKLSMMLLSRDSESEASSSESESSSLQPVKRARPNMGRFQSARTMNESVQYIPQQTLSPPSSDNRPVGDYDYDDGQPFPSASGAEEDLAVDGTDSHQSRMIQPLRNTTGSGGRLSGQRISSRSVPGIRRRSAGTRQLAVNYIDDDDELVSEREYEEHKVANGSILTNKRGAALNRIPVDHGQGTRRTESDVFKTKGHWGRRSLESGVDAESEDELGQAW